MIRSLLLRLTLIKPPRDVAFCLWKGKADLDQPGSHSDEHVSFDLTVNIPNDRVEIVSTHVSEIPAQELRAPAANICNRFPGKFVLSS